MEAVKPKRKSKFWPRDWRGWMEAAVFAWLAALWVTYLFLL